VIRLSFKGSRYEWDLGDVAHYSEELFQRHKSWRAWEIPPTSRHSLYRSLWELLYRAAEDDRRRTMDEIRRWANAATLARTSHRSLSLAEVSSLVKGQLIEAGAHTVTHSVLAALPPA
jgi:hypothetical protein